MLYYRVYGLVVASEVVLPELSGCSRSESADVEIRLGRVPSYLPGSAEKRPWVDHVSGRCLMRIENAGRFLVEQGRRIVIEPAVNRQVDAGAEPHPDLRLYLLGSVFAALLHQRAMLPIHASAVSTPLGVVAFTGPSGAGKSTIAGLFYRQMGFPIISDDVSVVDVQGRVARLLPGPRRLKLWQDALSFLGLQSGRAVQDLTNTDKFQLYLPKKEIAGIHKLRCLILLETSPDGSTPDLVPIKGRERFQVCCNAVYRYHMAPWFRSRESYIADIFRFSEAVEMFRWLRPRSLDAIADQTDYLWELLAQKQPDQATGT